MRTGGAILPFFYLEKSPETCYARGVANRQTLSDPMETDCFFVSLSQVLSHSNTLPIMIRFHSERWLLSRRGLYCLYRDEETNERKKTFHIPFDASAARWAIDDPTLIPLERGWGLFRDDSGSLLATETQGVPDTVWLFLTKPIRARVVFLDGATIIEVIGISGRKDFSIHPDKHLGLDLVEKGSEDVELIVALPPGGHVVWLCGSEVIHFGFDGRRFLERVLSTASLR